MKKTMIALLFVLTLVLCASCSKPSDENKTDDEKKDQETSTVASVDDFEWTITEKGVELINYKGNDTTVVIPDMIENKKVVSLGTAFSGNATVKTLVLPQYMEYIDGDWINSSSLKRIEGPQVRVIRDLKCDTLEELVLPKLNELNLIDVKYCDALRVLEIPSVETIVLYQIWNEKMFLWPTTLESVTIPENMLARMGPAFDDEDIPYVPIGALALESTLSDDGDENDYLDTSFAGAYSKIEGEDMKTYVYCNFFQHDEITVNGVKYSLD